MSVSKQIIINAGISQLSGALVSISDQGALVVERFHCCDLNYDINKPEMWAIGVGTSLREVLEAVGAKGHSVTLITTGLHTLTKFVKVPVVEPSKQNQSIIYQIQQNIPYPLSEVAYDRQVIFNDGIELDVLVAAIKEEVLNPFWGFFKQFGCQIVNVAPAPILDANAYRVLYGDPDSDIMILNIGAATTNMTILSSDTIPYLRTAQLAGNAVTQGIADEMGIKFDEAEIIKKAACVNLNEVSGPRASVVSRQIESFARRLNQDITRNIVSYRRQKKDANVTKVYLIGRGALLPGLAEAIADKQRADVSYLSGDLLSRVTFGPSIVEENVSSAQGSLSEIVGFVVAPSLQNAHQLNLLPKTVAEMLAFKKQKPWYIGAAVLLAASCAYPIYALEQSISDYKTVNSTLGAEVAELQPIHDRIVDIETKTQAIDPKILELINQTSKRGNWSNFFEDLQARLTAIGDVWIDEMSIVRQATADADSSEDGYSEEDYDAEDFEESDTSELDEEAVVSATKTGPLTMRITGRLLVKVLDESGNVSGSAFDRIKALRRSFENSPFVSEVLEPRFPEIKGNRILEFQFDLVLNSERAL